jgi:hypothetical protein
MIGRRIDASERIVQGFDVADWKSIGMDTRLFTSIVIFVSSYSPLAIILLIKDFNTATHWFDHPRTCVIALIVAVVSVLVLIIVVAMLRGGGFPVTVRRISNRSNELVNYTIPYMISFFAFNLGSWQDLASFGWFMALMCFLTIRTQSLFINPILAFMGFGLYDVEYEENAVSKQGIFLSRRELTIGQQCQIARVSYFLYFVN